MSIYQQPSASPALETLERRPRAAEGLSPGMLGMVLFIVSEVMFFGGLFAAYFFVRSQSATWPPAGVEKLELAFPAVNTAILLVSGVTMHLAAVAIRRGHRLGLTFWVFVTLALGSAFLGGQGYEYANAGFGPDDGIFGSTFFVLTGAHGAHVIVGLALLGMLLVRAVNGEFSRTRDLAVEASAAYWHFVDVVWVILFAIIYLAQ